MLKKLLFLATLALFPATAHAQAPNVIPGCVYNATPPTLADKQTVAIQCDSAGKLKTTGGSIGPGVATTCTALTLLYADAASLLQCSKTIPFSPTFAAGTITTSQPTTITQTWNAGGVTFTGLLVNPTSTASAAGSLIADLQLAGVSQFQVTKAGRIDAKGLVTSNGQGLGTTSTYGGTTYYNSVGIFGAGGDVIIPSTAFFAFNSGATHTGNSTEDVILARDAANTLAQRNGVNAQKLNVYGSYTDASNYERAFITSDGGGTTIIGGQGAGTGAGVGVRISAIDTGGLINFSVSGSINPWRITSAGHFISPTDNTYDIGASGATRPRNYFGAGNVTAGNFAASNSGYVTWTARSVMRSPSDGVITLANQAETDFGRLQFGGTTSSFPALKRSTTILQARLADDSLYAPFEADTVRTVGYTVAGLPAAGSAGRRAYVTNQLTACAVAGAALTGGGAVVCPVFDNGVAWVGD